MENVRSVGTFLRSAFNGLARRYPAVVREVRGRGLMLGIDLLMNGNGVVEEMMKRRILVNCTSETVLRFLPPFILTKEEAASVAAALDEVFASIHT